MTGQHSQRLKQLQGSYLALRLLEIICLGAGGTLLLTALGRWIGLEDIDSMVLAVTVGVVVVLQRVHALKLHQLTEKRMASFVNRYYPNLEWSTDLLVADQPLSSLQLIQREKALSQLSLLSSWRFPNQLWSAVSVLLLGVLLYFLVPDQTKESIFSGAEAANSPGVEALEAKAGPVSLENIGGTISPPSYTGQRNVSFKTPDIKAPESSIVNWDVKFSGRPERAMIIFSGADSLELSLREHFFAGSARVVSTGFYQVAWQDQSEWKTSDFFKLEVVPDSPPHLVVKDLAQFQEFEWYEIEKVKVKADLTDDYGLTDAYLIATVAKGSGESVKFREEKLPFEKPTSINGKKVNAEKSIDLKKMGLEPGDELYFYVEAWDNKTPVRQTERTETYFLQLKDTASYLVSNDGGLGVDLMPEYFRSQRQIIIDSEKLIGQRGKIAKEVFDNTSNGLAHDQKVLRLRYGQFMGEEFESGAVETHDHEEEGPAVPVNMEEAVKQFGHAHDTENEHNLVPAKKDDHHDGEEENPLEAFAHMHDSQEEATFFIESVKTKLRAALSLMWDAELHLRMNSPEESLPYQYKILKLLKEISNVSRIYVHRTGFDAPPIKEEKRLTGDLAEIKPAKGKYATDLSKPFPHAREAVVLLQKYLQALPAAPTQKEKGVLQQAGNEMAQLAIESPGKYLEGMGLLKSLIDDEVIEDEQTVREVMKVLWQMIPTERATPSLASGQSNELDLRLLKKMEAND